MTALKPKPKAKTKTDPRIQELRSLFRNLHAFRALYETDGISEVTGPGGHSWSLWDLEHLYTIAVKTDLLPLRQRQAIEMCLVMNMPEDEVSEHMHILKSNPVSMYATSGLHHLLREIDAGHLFNPWIAVELGEMYG